MVNVSETFHLIISRHSTGRQLSYAQRVSTARDSSMRVHQSTDGDARLGFFYELLVRSIFTESLSSLNQNSIHATESGEQKKRSKLSYEINSTEYCIDHNPTAAVITCVFARPRDKLRTSALCAHFRAYDLDVPQRPAQRGCAWYVRSSKPKVRTDTLVCCMQRQKPYDAAPAATPSSRRPAAWRHPAGPQASQAAP